MAKKILEDKCVHCGNLTTFAWVDTAKPHNKVYVCITCMSVAQVGHYASPAYERVGQATYTPLMPK